MVNTHTQHQEQRTSEVDRPPSTYQAPRRTFETVSLEYVRAEAGRKLLLDRFGETRAGN